MRLDLARLRERFGAVLFYGLQSVYELDAGLAAEESQPVNDSGTQRLAYETLFTALHEMVIVIPIKEERLKLLEGVLSGIPHACQIIIVSNSSRTPIDRFQLEMDVATTFAAYANRSVICVHQKDPQIAQALTVAGYPELLGEDGLVRSGKAEGMMVATLLAQLTGRRTVGFIDSDNYFPGAVLEYCRLYGAGFAMSRRHEHTMVRVSWHSKPKVMENSLYFAKWGRASQVTNAHLNALVSHYTGFETEAIKTGNAGEHAMTLNLAMQMGWSAGYSIEPYQLIYLMEQFGGILTPNNPALMMQHLNIYQIESRNPHLHESKGEEHVDQMIESSLSVIYHSPLTPERIKQGIAQDLNQRNIRPLEEIIPQMRQYPPLAQLDFGVFTAVLRADEDFARLFPESSVAPKIG